jgi:hypothetical protein
LAAGNRDGNITITDPNALNSPVVIPVHFSIITGDAFAFPSVINLTAQQGDTAQGSFSVENVGLPGTFLNYYVATSDTNHVSVPGFPPTLAAGAFNNQTVSVSTSDLAPRAAPYVFQLFVTNYVLKFDDPNRVSTLTVNVTVTRPAALVSANPSSLSYTAAHGSNPPGEFLTITNDGPARSLLHWTMTSLYSRTTPSSGLDLAGGTSQTLLVNYRASDLPAGNYNDTLTIHCLDDARVADVVVQLSIHVTGGQSVYQGNITGHVADSGDPPDPSFYDPSYGGSATLTATPGFGGGFDVTLVATANQSQTFGATENFSTGTHTFQWHIPQLTGPLTWSTPMNNHCTMQAVGSFVGNTFQGSWSMQPTDPNNIDPNESDNGGGTFILVLQ